MLRKRRTCPASSRKCGFSSGNFSSRVENNSPRFVAAQAIEPTPAVCRRSAVGICTVIDMEILPQRLKPHPFKTKAPKTKATQKPRLCAHRGCRFVSDFHVVQRFVQILFELSQLRRDCPFRLIDASQHVGRLQSIASDAQHRRLLWQNAILSVELAGGTYSYAARSLGKNTFGFRQQPDRVDHFGLAQVFAPSAAVLDGLNGIVPVGRIADGKRTRNSGWLLRVDLRAAGFYPRRNRRAPRGLRAK